MPEFHIYVSIHGNNTFPGGGMISKKVGIYLSQMHERKLKIDWFSSHVLSEKWVIIEYDVF